MINWNGKSGTRFGLTVDKGMGVFNGDMGVISEINRVQRNGRSRV